MTYVDLLVKLVTETAVLSNHIYLVPRHPPAGIAADRLAVFKDGVGPRFHA